MLEYGKRYFQCKHGDSTLAPVSETEFNATGSVGSVLLTCGAANTKLTRYVQSGPFFHILSHTYNQIMTEIPLTS